VVALGLVASGLGAAQAATAGAALEIDAPGQVKVGEPIQLKLVIRDAADIAGYETRLRFDTRVADFDGLLQRQNDVKASGRGVAALGPVVETDGVSFGQYS
jgi:hypothetical protein